MARSLLNRTGLTFGRLTILNRLPGSSPKFHCQCECGNTTDVWWDALQKGSTKSCGCLRDEHNALQKADAVARKAARILRMQDHNAAQMLSRVDPAVKNQDHPLYTTWKSMVRRCRLVHHDSYRMYGAKGITVCDRWADSFSDFVADMGPRPPGKTLDRIDNNKGYEPGNCRWATKLEQYQNSANTPVMVTLAGTTEMLSELCAKYDIGRDKVRADISSGLSPEVAFMAAVFRKKLWASSKGTATIQQYADCIQQAEDWLRNNP